MDVGIFFKIGREFIIDAVTVANGEPYGEAIQHGGHYDFHAGLKPTTAVQRNFKAHDYDFYPRGRVVFFPPTNTFRLYVDPCLTKQDLSRLKELFQLTGVTTEVALDMHYRCANCNKEYVDLFDQW